MPIRYWEPLSEAVGRTRSLLFQPFAIGRWFALGFTVWLIRLAEMGGSAVGSDGDVRTEVSARDWEGAADAVAEGFSNILPAGLAMMAVVAVTTILLVIALALLWVGCRARFIWLENLTTGDHAIGPHWTRFGGLGDGFFIWKLAFYFLSLLLIVPLVFFGGVFGMLGLAGGDGPGSLFGWALLGMAVLLVGVILAYIDFFAESFVTVIMHRRGIGVVAAWQEFRTLFDAQPGHFIAVGLWKALLNLAAFAALAIAGVMTCCIGLGIMAIPYLGTVIKLPVLAALRYFDLCWLGQIAPDLALPAMDVVNPAAPTPGSGPTP